MYDKDHVQSLLDAIRDVTDPLVLVWLGTCEITRKKGKYIYLRQYPYQFIEFTLSEYRELKRMIIQTNPSALVVFIDCPYYSISRVNNHSRLNTAKDGPKRPSLVVNKVRGKRDVQWAAKVDKKLKDQVDYYNNHLKIIRKEVLNTPPRLSQDLVLSNKCAGDRKVKYRLNYNLLTDGVHPGRILAKIWLYKLLRLAIEIQDYC